MSSTTSKTSRAVTLQRLQALISGTEKHLPNESYVIEGTAYTTATIVKLAQSLIDALVAVNAAQIARKDAVAAVHATNAKVAPILRGYRRIVRALLASATQTLADFGFEPPRARKPRTGAENAAAAAKAKATREMRGTVGPKKKAAIHGNVKGVEIVPVTEPAAVASPSVQAVSNASNGPSQGPSK